MSFSKNCFEDLISSFKMICSELEKKAEFNLKQVEKQCKEDFASNLESLRNFNEVVSGISETCSEVVKNSENLKNATIYNNSKNFIYVPNDLHSDIVKCINELYNMTPLIECSQQDKSIDERNKMTITEFIKVCEKNIQDVKDIQQTILEAKELI